MTPVAVATADVRRLDDFFECERIALAEDMQRPEPIESVDETRQAGLGVDVEFDFLPRSDAGKLLRERLQPRHQGEVALRKSEPLEYEIERIP